MARTTRKTRTRKTRAWEFAAGVLFWLAFLTKQQGLLFALFGVLSLVAGGYMMSQPVAALATLTLFLAAYFVASGILQIVAGFRARPEPGWGLVAFGGVVSLVLGVIIWRQFPISGIWAVGTLVGIQLLFSGWTLIAVGGLAKRAVQAAEENSAS